MADKIKLPLVGEVNKKTAIIGGVVVAAGIGIYVIRKQRQTAAAANASTTSTGMVTDPAGNQCQALDPVSGYCPGTQEDEQYQEQEASSIGEGYDEYPGGGAGYGYVIDAEGNECAALDPATGLCPVGTGISTGQTTSVTTNAQWVVEAEEQLGNTSTIQAALGYALSGSPVTQAQKNIFMEAIGLLGPPPQGYPPLNVTGSASTSSTGTATGSSTATATVPVTYGESADTALAKVRAAGFKATTSPLRNPKNEYVSTGSKPEGGSKAKKGSTVVIGVKVSKAGK